MTVPPASAVDLQLAIELAHAGGATTLEWFRHSGLQVVAKSDGSPVTAADLAAETHVRSLLAEHRPDDGIIGEEHDDVEGSTHRTWVIDPIDGTKAFSHGVALFATLVALVDEHGPAVGVIHLPALGETVAAGRGLGAQFNGSRCSVSDHQDLDGAYVMTSGFGYWEPDALDRMMAGPVVLRTWGDAYGYALVATGRADAMIDPKANPWDVAPMAVILSEAGGTFSSTNGQTGADAWRCGSGVATNGRIHQQIIDLLGGDSVAPTSPEG